MPPDEPVSEREPDVTKNPSWYAGLVSDIWKAIVPLLVSTTGLVGFVAFVGGAVTWSRFYAAQLPADEAVDALPDSALIVSGAFALTLFALLGALAVISAYAIDERGEPTKRMMMALVCLATLEAG